MIRAVRNLLILLLFSPILQAQQTYYWNADEGYWNLPSNWNPHRNNPHPNDELVFLGKAFVDGLPSDQEIRQLRISPGSEITFSADQQSTVRISGTPALEVGVGAVLKLAGNGGLTLFIAGTSHIFGELHLENGTHILQLGGEARLFFESGSTLHALPNYQGSFFEGETETVHFLQESAFVNHVSADPFVREDPVTLFHEGSVYRHFRSLMPSFSGRRFGNFEVHAPVSYLAPLPADLTIQNNLTVFSNRFEFFPSSGSGNLSIGQDLVHAGSGTLEIGNHLWEGQLRFSGPSARYRKTGTSTADARIERLAMQGPDLILDAPLIVSGNLSLERGKIMGSPAAGLILGPECSISSPPSIYPALAGEDYGTATSFVVGPLTRQGMQRNREYVFPVGEEDLLRPLIVHNSQGDVTVHYHRAHPFQNSSSPETSLPGIYVSTLEYWDISGLGPDAQVEPSFMQLTSGITSRPEYIKVLFFASGTWTDAGNAGFTGSLTENGSVKSLFAADGRFTLGSRREIEFLPTTSAEIAYDLRFPELRLRWKVSYNEHIEEFLWFESGKSGRKRLWGSLKPSSKTGQESYELPGPIGIDHDLRYTLLIRFRNGDRKEQEICIPDQPGYGLRIYPNPVCEKIFIFFPNLSSKSKISIVHYNGTVLIQKVMEGPNAEIDVSALKPGLYYLNFSSESINRIRPFIKQ